MKKLLFFTLCAFAAMASCAQIMIPQETDVSYYGILAGKVSFIEQQSYKQVTGGIEYTGTDEYTFLNNNISISRFFIKDDDPDELKDVFLYNSKGQITSQYSYDNLLGDLQTTYTYNNDGELTSAKEVSDDVLFGYSIDVYYEVDKKGRVIKAKETYDGKNVSGYILYTWDKKGNLLREEKQGKQGKFSYSYDYEYDDEGNMLKQVYTNSKNEPSTTTYVYYLNGLLKSSKTEGYKTTSHYEYSNYDATGNWTRKKSIIKDSDGTTTSTYFYYRKIKYANGTVSSGFDLIEGDNESNLKDVDINGAYYNRSGEDRCWFYIPGFTGNLDVVLRYINNKSNDVIAYEPVTGATFLLRDYRNQDSGSRYDAEVLSKNPKDIFWATDGEGGYWTFEKAKFISGTKSFSVGNDLYVYFPDKMLTYKYGNYKNATPNKAYKAEKISNDQQIVYWLRPDEEHFRVYYQGIKQLNTSSFWLGNDLIVYCPGINKTYKLKDYKSKGLNKAFIAESVYTSSGVLAKKDGTRYGIYVNGKTINYDHVNSSFVYDDLLVYDSLTTTTYLLKNYKNKGDEVFEPVIISKTAHAVGYKANSSGDLIFYYHGRSVPTSNRTSKYDTNNKDVIVTIKDSGKKFKIVGFRLAYSKSYIPAVVTY